MIFLTLDGIPEHYPQHKLKNLILQLKESSGKIPILVPLHRQFPVYVHLAPYTGIHEILPIILTVTAYADPVTTAIPMSQYTDECGIVLREFFKIAPLHCYYNYVVGGNSSGLQPQSSADPKLGYCDICGAGQVHADRHTVCLNCGEC